MRMHTQTTCRLLKMETSESEVETDPEELETVERPLEEGTLRVPEVDRPNAKAAVWR